MDVDVIDSFRGEYFFLSNFYRAEIVWGGRLYATTEHAFQAAKAIDQNDHEFVRRADTPAIAKRLGQQIKIRPDWESARVGVMRTVLRLKFAIPMLRMQLLGTGNAKLIEGNTWGDRFWGQVEGQGENWLGRLLMELRDEIVQI